MSLKIVATLIVAGLVAHSSGYVLKGLRRDFKPVPGFSFTSKKTADHDELSISAKVGSLWLESFIFNHTAWSLHQVNGSSTISQEASASFLDVVYWDVETKVGDATNDGEWAWVNALLDTATFVVSLKATENDNKCTLAVNIANSKIGIELVMFAVDDVFNAQKPDLGAAIWGQLADVLPATLTDSFEQILQKIDTDALCKKILAGKPEDFPELQL